MAIKPSPTIAGKLRKLFSNNKQTIEPAIPEEGGDSSPFVVTFNSENGSEECDKTFAQIKEAYEAGKQIKVMLRFVPNNAIGGFRLCRMNTVFYNNDFGFIQLRALGTIDATDTTLVTADCYIAPGLVVGRPDGVTIKYYNYEHDHGLEGM